MYNYYRWFPKGKVVFVAPTRPLVEQQMEACRSIMGMHKGDVAKLIGIGPQARSKAWAEHRVLFMTPQILANDLRTGSCPWRSLVALVLDEVHRAQGDADMVRAVELLRSRGGRPRLLGLSATPGNSHAAIQSVLSKLALQRVEFRSEEDADVAPYVHERTVEAVTVPRPREAALARQALLTLQLPLVLRLNRETQARLLVPNERTLLSAFAVQQARGAAAAAAAGAAAGGSGGGSSFGGRHGRGGI